MPLAEDFVDEPAKVQLEAFLDQHRLVHTSCLDGVDEQRTRRHPPRAAAGHLGQRGTGRARR